jgi:hypothetical protein
LTLTYNPVDGDVLDARLEYLVDAHLGGSERDGSIDRRGVEKEEMSEYDWFEKCEW